MSKILLNNTPNEYKELYSFLIKNYYYSSHKNIKIERTQDSNELIIEYFKHNDEDIKIVVYFDKIIIGVLEFVRGGFANKNMYLKNLKNNDNIFNLKFIKFIHEIMSQELNFVKEVKFFPSGILSKIEKIVSEDF